MDISEIQSKIHDFQQKRAAELGADLTPELAFLHLNEEVGEIARQLINKKYPGFRKFDEENLREEVVQGLLDLLLLSKLLNIDLPEVMEKKIEQMKKRSMNSL